MANCLMPRLRSEVNAIHVPVVAELRRWIKPGWRFFHCPNGEYRSPRTAGRLKAMGVLPGIPDLVLMPPSGPDHFMEFKLPRRPKLTEAQEEFRMWALKRGNPYVVAISQLQAFEAFCWWDCWQLKLEQINARSREGSTQAI